MSSVPTALGRPCVLLKLGEVVLKGRNRELFERRLQNNIRTAVRDTGVNIGLSQRAGVIVVSLSDEATVEQADAVAARCADVMGLTWVHRAWKVGKTPKAVVAAALELVKGALGSGGGDLSNGAPTPGGKPSKVMPASGVPDRPTFAVRARRRDKRFPLTSMELDRLVGEEIVKAYELPVRLKNPDLTVHIEVDQHEVFVFTDGIPGQGGLPVGMSGRALVLMSGGIDSPVAAHRMMRRGLRVDFLHFSGMPFTGPESIYKAYALVRELDRFQGGSRLFTVAFGNAQQSIKSSGQDRLQIIAQRRLMLKTGEELAHRLGAAALITGDSLGQVSSQTLQNITALDDAVELPILRPLIGMDKMEIMAEARRISTLAISELPDEDCCTLLAPRRAETRAKIDDLRVIEKRLDAGEMAVQLAQAVQEHHPGRERSGRESERSAR